MLGSWGLRHASLGCSFLAVLAAGLGGSGCAVDRSGLLPGSDSGAGSCVSDSQCNDAIDCTIDTCVDSVCVNAPSDGQCVAMPGGVCVPGTGCSYSSCIAADCAENNSNPALCEVGECVGDTCTSVPQCTGENQVCCGDGTCLTCDDGNPCTANTCVIEGGAQVCAYVPLDGTLCDDGRGCTTGDVCVGDVCTVTECVAPTTCSEDGERCVGCNGDDDCPAPTEVVFPCMFEDTTGNRRCAGEQIRETTTYNCNGAQECIATVVRTPEPCTAPNNTVCGSTTLTPGACMYRSTCVEEGNAVDVRHEPLCNGSGACVTRNTDVNNPDCDRTTTNVSCGMDILGTWSACVYDMDPTCDRTGVRTRPRSIQRCATGTCQTRADGTESDTAFCDRVTAGDTCMPTTNGEWSMCTGFSDVCDTTGTQTRTVTTFTCSGDTCGSTPTTEMRNCTRPSTNGTSCGDVITGDYGACMYGSSADCVGSRSRTVTTPTCMGSTCQNVVTNEVDPSNTCRTMRNGHMCGSVSMMCEQKDPDGCSDEGETVITTPTCDAGVCDPVTSTGADCTYDPIGEECISIACPGPLMCTCTDIDDCET